MKSLIGILLIGTTVLFAASSKMDDKTGLVWQDNKDIASIEKSYTEAQKYCQNLTLDGFTDWRLPTLKEAYTIVDLSRDRPTLKKGFEVRLNERFWTDTEVAKNPDKEAWRLSMSYGEAEPYKKTRAYRVRCVRGIFVK